MEVWLLPDGQQQDYEGMAADAHTLFTTKSVDSFWVQRKKKQIRRNIKNLPPPHPQPALALLRPDQQHRSAPGSPTLTLHQRGTTNTNMGSKTAVMILALSLLVSVVLAQPLLEEGEC
ncbi:hypothetical protein E2C01_052537 [Portunus trituberculatus]|uniref:Uncharacterized protein n=1 Tax=Portunus trituberculatus TaxID=210409 RepID=A0A5B7GEW6_PORTR|nr:hypothetical protein [Portunus trituberculatus]